jgi:hypothetical protein
MSPMKKITLTLSAAVLLSLAPAAQAGSGLTLREAKKATEKVAKTMFDESGGFARGVTDYGVGPCKRRTRTRVVCDAELYLGESSTCVQKVNVTKRSGRVRARKMGEQTCSLNEPA